MLARTPVAAEKRVRADEVDGAGDPAAGPFRHDEDDAVGHGPADLRIELAGEVGPAPFARAGLHVEAKEHVPDVFRQFAAGQPMHADAVLQRLAALPLDGLALARRQRLEEGVEAGVAGVLPVELLVGAPQEALLGEVAALRLRHEGDVDGGRLLPPAQLPQARRQRGSHRLGVGARPHQQAPSGRGRERHGHLELGVVVAAGALVGLGPAAVEHVLAARMRFQIAGHRAEERAVRAFREQMLGLPAGPGGG